MTPFIEGGIESLNGFMPVPNYEPERFYGINFEKDLLHNTRNRVIVNHPKIIITLDTEFISSHQVRGFFQLFNTYVLLLRSLDDDFDPFEPFEGPVRLPQSYLGAHETNSNSDEAQPKKHCVDQNDAIRKWGECIAQKEN
ncbi:hypothetical protein DICVIV_02376 [Dictyocaulus viviparus]|uniref:BCD1 alpha/beta domain-containing protein n=1 Tax=Dictyocaulus viviparus TaxID=29172 RepID=A0A0D8Y637_DICVI|nr:hypothetical protein DICVIV_02376 [Dictyocaulus viviparus]